jgi:hypothetical protein
MRRIAIWTTFCTLLLITGYSHAQSTPDTWPIVEHCVGNATKPPVDWHFNGTLLLGSSKGLHTYQQGWNTPRIQVFGSKVIGSASQLSPNAHWYATINGQRQQEQVVTAFSIDTITVYNTTSDEKYVVPWKNIYFASHRVDGHTLYWLDNQHFLYSKDDSELNEKWFTVNPFTQEVTDWDSQISPSQFMFVFSPDRKNAAYSNWGNLFWIFTNGDYEVKVPIIGIAGWSPDSSHLAAYTATSDPFAVDNLVIYDRVGKQVQTVFHFPANVNILRDSSQAWSTDGQYLLFASNNLYIADMGKKRVIDTCIPTNYLTVVWSPSSTQFAMVELYDRKRQVQIFDLDNWARYIVAYHSGSVIGWRTDD